jgi:PhnB protein
MRLAWAVLLTMLLVFSSIDMADNVLDSASYHASATIAVLAALGIVVIAALQLYISRAVRDGGRPRHWPGVLASQAVLVYAFSFGFNGGGFGMRQTASVAEFRITITPVLTVRCAAQAVAFYERAFGAKEIYRNVYSDGKIVVEIGIGEARFRVADEAPDASNLSPQTLNGTTVRINLLVADPDGLAARAVAHSAMLVAPVADQPYGLRQGRIADPFGHHWLIGRPLAGGAGDWAQAPDR